MGQHSRGLCVCHQDGSLIFGLLSRIVLHLLLLELSIERNLMLTCLRVYVVDDLDQGSKAMNIE